MSFFVFVEIVSFILVAVAMIAWLVISWTIKDKEPPIPNCFGDLRTRLNPTTRIHNCSRCHWEKDCSQVVEQEHMKELGE